MSQFTEQVWPVGQKILFILKVCQYVVDYWLWGANLKFRHEGNSSASLVMPNSYPEWQNFLFDPNPSLLGLFKPFFGGWGPQL